MAHIYFEIQADDLQRASDFYGEIFGWKFQKNPHAPVEYRWIETGGTRGGLLKRPADTPPPECGTNAYVCSIEVDDFDATAKKIEKLGGQVAMPKFAVPKVCWQGYFLDTEGNTFGIFEVDEKAQ
ncbi:VOC family protein [Rhodohalobacter sp. 614A]|uniref:VOC family protein n=1 Tax=Rhodohalobacter sp. 614A TaxID=2908649 RepID=UPI001F24B2DA|nr:VOC family protein [Rhodohalobacter sp. 614A]